VKIICQIYKSETNREMYLYVEKTQGLEAVPDALLGRFGKPLTLMVLLLEPGKKLARANIHEVMSQIVENGFYLQMPPTVAELYGRDGNKLNG
jgi:uncharacterized protein YcgL (UPF0745 family)